MARVVGINLSNYKLALFFIIVLYLIPGNQPFTIPVATKGTHFALCLGGVLPALAFGVLRKQKKTKFKPNLKR